MGGARPQGGEGSASARPGAGGPALCPHCFLVIEEQATPPWPVQMTRCPHCRLVVGPGRARTDGTAKPGARGAAAGVLAHRAKRDEGEPHASPAVVRAAIRRAAVRAGARPERLLMVEYQQQAAGDRELPDLTAVFAAFGSWKRARREAAGSGTDVGAVD